MHSEKSTPFHVQDIPNLSGYVAIVTGGMLFPYQPSSIPTHDKHSHMIIGNSGIGYETSFQLALHGTRVYIAGRSPDRIKKAIEQMKASSAKPLGLHMLEMDLQSLDSVMKGAEAFMRQESRLDLLINNAGVRHCRLLSQPPPRHEIFEPPNDLRRSWQSLSNSQSTASKPNGKPTTLLPSSLPKHYSLSSSPRQLPAAPRTVSASSMLQVTQR